MHWITALMQLFQPNNAAHAPLRSTISIQWTLGKVQINLSTSPHGCRIAFLHILLYHQQNDIAGPKMEILGVRRYVLLCGYDNLKPQFQYKVPQYFSFVIYIRINSILSYSRKQLKHQKVDYYIGSFEYTDFWGKKLCEDVGFYKFSLITRYFFVFQFGQ